jgi:Na+/H+ antiporter NhaD/arsenite permease-like protein
MFGGVLGAVEEGSCTSALIISTVLLVSIGSTVTPIGNIEACHY